MPVRDEMMGLDKDFFFLNLHGSSDYPSFLANLFQPFCGGIALKNMKNQLRLPGLWSPWLPWADYKPAASCEGDFVM